MRTREELRSQIEGFLTLEDIIQLALAQVPKTQFSADSHNWSAALYELWTKFRQQVPELERVSFSDRPPLPPQTDDVYALITTLAMAGRIGLPNPRLHKVIMSNAVKKRIRRDKSIVQDKYGSLIPRMAEILKRHLCTV